MPTNHAEYAKFGGIRAVVSQTLLSATLAYLAACPGVVPRLRDESGYFDGDPLPSGRFLHCVLRRGISRMSAPVLFYSQADQNCQHNEADDPFFLSCENEHQLRGGFT